MKNGDPELLHDLASRNVRMNSGTTFSLWFFTQSTTRRCVARWSCGIQFLIAQGVLSLGNCMQCARRILLIVGTVIE